MMDSDKHYQDNWQELKTVQASTLEQIDVFDAKLKVFLEDPKLWMRIRCRQQVDFKQLRKDLIDFRVRVMQLTE